MNNIFIRRSIRRYTDKKVEKDKIERVLRAAMQAPSAKNQMGWEFIVVEDKKTLEKLSETSEHTKMVKDSGVTIAVVGNKHEMEYPDYWQQDLSAATQNMMLQCVEEGLGSVWLGIAPLEERMDFVKEILFVPEGIEVFSLVSIGYPVDENKFIDRWNSNKVHYEKY